MVSKSKISKTRNSPSSITKCEIGESLVAFVYICFIIAAEIVMISIGKVSTVDFVVGGVPDKGNPRQESDQTPGLHGRGFEDHCLQSEDGLLRWHSLC